MKSKTVIFLSPLLYKSLGGFGKNDFPFSLHVLKRFEDKNTFLNMCHNRHNVRLTPTLQKVMDHNLWFNKHTWQIASEWQLSCWHKISFDSKSAAIDLQNTRASKSPSLQVAMGGQVEFSEIIAPYWKGPKFLYKPKHLLFCITLRKAIKTKEPVSREMKNHL